MASLVSCPNCGVPIEIVAANCGIFICGATLAGQVNPHDEATASELKLSGKLVAGCAKQFRLVDGRPTPCTGM